MLKIGNVTCPSRLFLAPMAEITHTAFRQIVSHYGGCGCFFSEMQPVITVLTQKHDSFRLFFSEPERPFFYQLTGSDPDTFRQAIVHLESFHPDGFDINMGCPHPALRLRKSGAEIMENPDLAENVIRMCKKTTSLPVTAKIRLGRKEDSGCLLEFSKMLEQAGCDAVTLHPRTSKEYLSRKSRWKYVALLKQHLQIPVIGNGDVKTAEEIQERFDETGCDGIMIGRGAVTRPWIFREYENPDETLPDPVSCLREFMELLEKHLPENRQLGRLKRFSGYFQKNFKFGHGFHIKIHNTKSIHEAREIVKNFCASRPELK